VFHSPFDIEIDQLVREKMSMQGKRQFSWQPTLIDDWATEPADEAKPLPVDNNEENLERKNENDPKGFLKRKQALFHQAAIDFQVRKKHKTDKHKYFI